MNPSDNGETSEKVPKKGKLGLKNPFTKPAKLTKMDSIAPKEDIERKNDEKKNLTRNKTEELEISVDKEETVHDAEPKLIKTPKEKKKFFRKEKKSASLDSGTRERKSSVEDKMKPKIKAANLVRRLSLGAIGVKYKKTTHLAEGADYDDVSPESTSSGATPTSIKRHTPEGEDMSKRSISEISLTDIDETDDNHSEVSKISKEQRKSLDQQSNDENSLEDNVKFELYKPKPQNMTSQLKIEFLSEAPTQIVEPVQVVGESVTTTTTLPFAVSSWRPTEPIKRPIESPSPEDSIRRRIAWVAQPTVYTSVDNEEVVEEKTTTKLDKVSIKSYKDNETIEQTYDVEITKHHKLTVTKPVEKRVGRESPLPNIEEDRTESFEQFEDLEDITLQPESTTMPPFGEIIADNLKETSNLSQSMERKEFLYKILVIGELGTGKTSIIKRYVHQFFSQHYRATIGVDFALKVITWDPNTIIRLQLWDIAGQERFGNMTRVYYKEAVGAFIVFDVTRAATFEAVQKWKTDLDSKVQLPDGSSIPCVLLANKCDQPKDGPVTSPSKMDEYCAEKGFTGWFETSAKENINIEEAAKALVNKILQNDKLSHNQDMTDCDRIAIDGRNGHGDHNTSGSCSC